MTDKELATRFKRIVLDEGKAPWYHQKVIRGIAKNWPMLYRLIKEVQDDHR